MLCKELCEDLRRNIETSNKQHKGDLSQSPACTEAIKFINPMSKKYWQLKYDGPLGIPGRWKTFNNYCIYLLIIPIKKISVEKSKWNVALFHLEMRFSTFGQTEKGYILFSFSELWTEAWKIWKGNYEREAFKGSKHYF